MNKYRIDSEIINFNDLLRFYDMQKDENDILLSFS